MEKTDPLLRISHVRKSFGTLEVLKDISIDVYKGDVVSILGPSGSGKTTLLRCINFLREGRQWFHNAGRYNNRSQGCYKRTGLRGSKKNRFCFPELQPFQKQNCAREYYPWLDFRQGREQRRRQ